MVINEALIWNLLTEVPDPEVPAINVVELGVVRSVEIKQEAVCITITPTYTGCPAMKTIEQDIIQRLKEAQIIDIEIKTILTPAWTTDWIKEEAREKLRVYGIAPPEHSSADKNSILGKTKTINCPLCGSRDTIMQSQFGSTACKALYKCKSCLEPFDYFKCI
ncbi:MAG: phenylacetate-CoA oxygenase subunit PaaJ [Bacteroidetes bacterium]|nr:phenylacetate-CoA oxygenase subunit PaaJ [Bacteroidota bacterium]HET6243613.1 1,2-phenylacetyl-CoA epoxidase subunit PaaD [Bacteroidia bacterium]